ncbi:MAG: Hpt domain-containing protein [Actinomycetes bacterium]
MLQYGGMAGSVQEDGEAFPLVDPDVLAELGDKLGSPAMAARFASDYLGLWDSRLHRLLAGFARGDIPAALDAVISIRVSSAMVGGHRLAWLAGQLEEAVSSGDLAAGRELLDGVAGCGRETVAELRLIQADTPAGALA